MQLENVSSGFLFNISNYADLLPHFVALCVCACVRACLHTCVRVCVRADIYITLVSVS